MIGLIGGLFFGGLIACALFGLIGLVLIGAGLLILLIHCWRREFHFHSDYPPYGY